LKRGDNLTLVRLPPSRVKDSEPEERLGERRSGGRLPGRLLHDLRSAARNTERKGMSRPVDAQLT
jgi:hypothetical protein